MTNFKPGDWVKYNTCGKWIIGKVSSVGPRGYGELWGEVEDIIVNIEDERDYFFDDSEDLKHWQPKPDEWCWFWNDETDIPKLRQLISVSNPFDRPTVYITHPDPATIMSRTYCGVESYKYCEPFIGQLPSGIKDNK